MKNWSPNCAVSVFLLLLLLTPVSPNCRKGTADECRLAHDVPGFFFAGDTINIVLLKPIYPGFVDEKKSADCTVCENPILKGRPFQRLPEFVKLWQSEHICLEGGTDHQSAISVAEELTTLQVTNDWRKELDVAISPSDKLQWALAGSRSVFTEKCVEKSDRGRFNFLLHFWSCSYYRMEVDKKRLPTGFFNGEITQLPEKYNHSSKSEYFYLINRFGTHWMSEFQLGVRIMMLTCFSECETVLENLTISELRYCGTVDLQKHTGLNQIESKDCEKMNQYKLKTFDRYKLLEGGSPFSTGIEWAEEAKSQPGLLSFSLEPLHTLVDEADPRRESLRQALSEYVKEHILWRNCSRPCLPGSQPSATEFCSCKCPNTDFTDTMCCARRPGVAKLRVTILHAANLWGDLISPTDCYVSVSFKNWKMCTHTVWNNNNPTWNSTLDLGVIELNKDFNVMQLQVWDEDSGWDDDLLGECSLSLEVGQTRIRQCVLKHGFVTFTYLLECGHNLIGQSCWNYFTGWPFSANHPDSYHYEEDPDTPFYKY